MPPDPLRVHLIDNDRFSRLSITAMLEQEPDIFLDEAHDSVHEALSPVIMARPDILLFDASAYEDRVSEAMKQLRREAPSVKVIVIANHAASEIMSWAYGVGVAGFVSKRTIDQHLSSALRMVAIDYTLFAQPVDVESFPPRRDSQWELSEAFKRLRPIDFEVVRLVALGHTNGEIARRIHMSEGTVKFCLARAMNQLGLSNRVQVAVAATEAGFVSSAEFIRI
ncbi:MAG: response regulator transcription factor [Micrococcaceae bacterium]